MSRIAGAVLCFILTVPAVHAQGGAADTMAVYQQLKKFELGGGSISVSNLVLKRDRGEITFTSGTLYFETPVAGRVRGAVFVGEGNFKAEVPPNPFEKEFVQRLLKADRVESDFKTAVLRFADDTFDVIGKGAAAGGASAEALKLAQEFEPQFLRETGANISGRVAMAILNSESPGFFLAQFDKGKRKRFAFMMDYQGRIPTSNFGVNGGEKGIIFTYRDSLGGNDVWMAFYSEEDYQAGRVNYSDVFHVVDATHYDMRVDVRDPGKQLTATARIEMEVTGDNVRAIPFALSESMTDFDNIRRKWGMKLAGARMGDGSPLAALQEEWEGGLTVYLPRAHARGEKVTVELDVVGDNMFESDVLPGCFYLRNNSEWFPRHGHLDRATFDIKFRHKKRLLVAGSGKRVKEGPWEDSTEELLTQWRMDEPIPLIAFGVGRFDRHEETAKQGDQQVPIEFYSMPSGVMAIKEDFMMAEMMNSLNYFTVMFGKYPYPKFGAVFHPRGFGQGFASLLLIPNTDRASKYVYSFIAHETAHQWWGNIVAWRSYRDQWLSEGFAEYSGILYTGLRAKPKAAHELIDEMRRSLKDPPVTETGIGKGRLVDVGPIILGLRLNTRETFGAYQALTYNKGGLVLRMLHFMFTDPATGNGDAFFTMMKDFVKRHHGTYASTDDFIRIANEHFVNTPIAKKYGLKDLNWFFRQWVYQAHYPSYRMVYATEGQPDGSVLVKGTVFQDNAPEDWFMPLPLVFEFDKGQQAAGTVHAYGRQTPFQIKLPMKPKKVELDPTMWVISEKTTTQGK